MASKTFNDAFRSLFDRIRKEQIYSSIPSTKASHGLSDNAEIKAAFSKCIDFNVIVNRERSNNDEAFLFLSGLRGIVEDLIILKYSLQFSATVRTNYFELRQQLDSTQAILAQKKFFEANNPFQSVVGSSISLREAEKRAENAKSSLQAFWKSQGHVKRNGPSVKDMSEKISLNNTYDYIYFAASNFVHFNPHALLRTGWGPENGPFTFSVGNFGGYYRDFAAFYGAILYIGFAASFVSILGNDVDYQRDISEIKSVFPKIPRWPELVTFEELNINRPPQRTNPLTDALLGVGSKSDDGFVFMAILNEVMVLTNKPINSNSSS